MCSETVKEIAEEVINTDWKAKIEAVDRFLDRRHRRQIERKELKLKARLHKDKLELEYIQSIATPDKLKAYEHRNNRLKFFLAVKVGGAIIGAVISPTVAVEMLKNLFI